MKTSTVHSLITARTLYDEASRLVASGDRHMCSAGLVMLQDALEIVFLAMLIEKEVDEQKTLDSKSFDELLGELKKAGVTVPKSGTLKALNKQRVITKHYGQLAEPATVQTYAEAAELAIDSIIPQVLGKRLREIFLTDLMTPGEATDFLTEAAKLIEEGGDFLDALISIRKAIFVEIENEYSVHDWEHVDPNDTLGRLGYMGRGIKAPYWKRNRDWIAKHVNNPIDYVQIDHERLRLDGIEWGVNTAELENLRRLTPDVFRRDKGGAWHIRYDVQFPPNEATPSNARYCLDRAISILLRKQQHAKTKRWPGREEKIDVPIYLDEPVYEKASQESKVVHNISADFEYSKHSIVSGFNPEERYLNIFGYKFDPKDNPRSGLVFGYLRVYDEV